jgi:hypothetical protein
MDNVKHALLDHVLFIGANLLGWSVAGVVSAALGRGAVEEHIDKQRATRPACRILAPGRITNRLNADGVVPRIVCMVEVGEACGEPAPNRGVLCEWIQVRGSAQTDTDKPVVAWPKRLSSNVCGIARSLQLVCECRDVRRDPIIACGG